MTAFDKYFLRAVGVLIVLWALWPWTVSALAQEQISCEDQREALAVQVQILQNARAQVEANLAILAAQMSKAQREATQSKAANAKMCEKWQALTAEQKGEIKTALGGAAPCKE